MKLKTTLPFLAMGFLNPIFPLAGKPTHIFHDRHLHTQGAQIMDAGNNPVTMAGINWFGMETSQYAPQGLDQRNMDDLVAQMKSLGFNTIRLPYSDDIFQAASRPSGISYDLNPKLANLSALEIMDAVVESARAHGMWVVLDRHRPSSAGQSALWYTPAVPESVWLNDLTTLASRYLWNDSVVGIDLHNEPHDPATWGSGVISTDWRLAAERGGEAVLAANPHLLVLVEGVQTFDGSSYWWGGNLMGAAQYPVELTVPNQLVYEAHDYPSSVSPQPWFNASNYPANLPAIWNQYWGYLATGDTPVILGEFGTLDQTQSDQQWLTTLVTYLNSNQISALYWCMNPDSGDTGGILENDWTTVIAAKINAISPVLTSTGPPLPLPPPSKAASVLAKLKVPFTHPSKSPDRGKGVSQLRTAAPKPVIAQSAPPPEVAKPAENMEPVAVKPALYQPASAGPAHISVHSAVSPNTSAWWGELALVVENAQPITALHATVTVHRTPGVKAAGQYNTFWGGTMQQGVENADGTITYSYAIPASTGGVPNGRWLLAAQFNGNGTPRLTAQDRWSIEAVTNGETQVLTGHF